MVASYRYDPFGNLVSKSGPLADANVYRFSSKEFHVNSGLYYYGYRFYSPNLQRWINRDPIGISGGLNLYGFVGNRPLSQADPDGRDTYKIVGPYLVVYPSLWKFWRPSQEVYCGTRELYEKIIGSVKLEQAIEAAAVTVIIAGMAEGFGDLKTCKDSKLKNDGIDAHDLKEDYVGKENVSKYNIAKDSEDNVFLVPVKKGEGEVVPVPIKYPVLPEIYPIEEK
jgi:RHS repeat-associated protein